MLEIRLLAAEQTTRYTGGFDYCLFENHTLCVWYRKAYSYTKNGLMSKISVGSPTVLKYKGGHIHGYRKFITYYVEM